MKNPERKSFTHLSRSAAMIGFVACSLTFPASLRAFEDPPGCSYSLGGNGASYQSGVNFGQAQAHVGDCVPVIPNFGMLLGACRAINVTGSLYITTGKLTNFLNNATLDPGINVVGPHAPCEPGPYNVLITPALVGAGVSSPKGSVSGRAKTVLALEIVEGIALTGTSPEPFGGEIHATSIAIVTPALQVGLLPAYPLGRTCFPRGANVQCTGYLTNTGDIALTNVTVMDHRTAGQLQLLNPANGVPLPATATLQPGDYAMFASSFMPTPTENSHGSAASQITVTARDTTVIGGPRSLVTNATATTSFISPEAILTDAAVTADHKFGFNVSGQADVKYVVQATSDLNTGVWVSLATNTASFNFVDEQAGQFPKRFYRVMSLP